MNSLLKALEFNDNFTANGMSTHSTSGKGLLDLFFDLGAVRDSDHEAIINRFASAYSEDKLLAIKMLFYGRDIRGGQGERRFARICLRYLACTDEKVLLKNLHLIPFYGRWDDLLYILGASKNVDYAVTELIIEGLKNKDTAGLVAKWMPREKSSMKSVAIYLMNLFEWTPKNYRKIISQLSNTVENIMSQSDWNKIDFEHVPSKAMMKYRKAFYKHQPDRFAAYIEAVENGEAEIKTATLVPYDIVYKLRDTGWYSSFIKDKVLINQWNNLPRYYEPKENSMIIPVVDTSGSMYGGRNVSPIDVALSLGIYIAENNIGPFKDYFITFSNYPELQKLKGLDIVDKLSNLAEAAWDMNTDIEAVFNLLLNKAINNNIPQNEMPDTILIISDMEFDRCAVGYNKNVMEMIEQKYENAGYVRPKIVFWKANSLSGNKNYPVKFDTFNTALISGLSPVIMKSVLECENMTPWNIMLKTLNSQRYDVVNI